MSALADVLWSVEGTILWYYLGVNSFYALLILLSIPELWKHWKVAGSENLQRYFVSEALPPISVSSPPTTWRPGSSTPWGRSWRSDIRSTKSSW